MSINAWNEVWARSQASRPAVLLLLLAIADEADDWGHKAGPSLEVLGPKCRCDPRTVIRLIQAARRVGALLRLSQGQTAMLVRWLNYQKISPDQSIIACM